MTVYFVDDDELCRKAVERLLRRDAEVSVFTTGAEIINAVNKQIPDVLITDVRMPGMSGIDVVRRAREIDPDLPIIVLSGAGDVATVVESLKAGAYDYVEKINLTSLLIGTLQRALERRRLTAENRRLRAQLGSGASESALLGRHRQRRRL
jgi:two-component system C4-dicarboxylate transport response regulator DctD